MTKKIFGFISSVRLAVPLMLTILVVVAYGTIVESNYNSEMAKLKVYHSLWFSALMVILWINIFTSTLSRWPFKKRHIGFVMVHIGLLLLLLGGLFTSIWGIDGSLRLTEGERGQTVVLSELVLGLSSGDQSSMINYPLPRSLYGLDANDLKDVNSQIGSILKVLRLEPFVETKMSTKASGQAPKEPLTLQFRLKSAFFDVEQTLQSQEQSSLQMGPATFRLVKADSLNIKTPQKGRTTQSVTAPSGESTEGKTKKKATVGGKSFLVVKDRKTTKEIKKINISAVGQKFEINGVNIEVVKMFKNAVVAQGGVKDDTSKSGSQNPALELKLTKSAETAREVCYARFPNFSLNQKDNFGFAFEFQSGEISAEAAPPAMAEASASAVDVSAAAAHPKMAMGGPPPGDGKSNEVQFQYSMTDPGKVKVILYKAGKMVQESFMKAGEVLQTPWMGMQLTLTQMSWEGDQSREVTPTQPQEKADSLPPAAIYIAPKDAAPADENWLVEGDQMQLSVNDRNYLVYFGRKMIRLPFQLELKKFSKIDYPGTSMAKSFESQVFVPDQNRDVVISMNEPLFHSGYTVYQASFEQLPNGQYASIFSINRDPGRPWKYAGGLILSLGIIVFTLMRTKWYQKKWGL